MPKLSTACAVATSLVLVAAPAGAALINTYSGPGPAYVSNIITTRSSTCCGASLESVHLVNGLGFTGGTPPNFTDADFDTVPEHYWYDQLSSGGWLSGGNAAGTEWVAFDLGATFFMEKMRVWNYDQSGLPNRSTATANVWYSTAVSPGLPGGPAANPALSGWTQLGSGPFAFQNPLGPTYDTIDDVMFPITAFSAISARHILIDVVTSHGDQFVGLGEVQFFDTVPTPEPSTFALLGIGVAGLAIRARRRRRAAA